MIYIDGMSIAIPRGDSASVTLVFSSNEADGHELVFTVKGCCLHEHAPLIVKRVTVEDARAVVTFDREDTDIAPKRYRWDVCLVKDGEKNTPIKPQTFEILEVVNNV